jgi:hypothetical protein
MPQSHSQIEIGNLVVKFGEHLNLLDMLSEVVAPAIFDPSLRRTYSETTYLFYRPEFIDTEDELLIAGKLVKDTVLERQQLLVDGQLQEATGSLPSSPSSLFVLLLGCHRLLFVRQHRGSPTLDNFRSTLSHFLKRRHRTFLKAKAQEADPETGDKPTLKALVELYPYPSVDLTPLGSNDSIHSFLGKFQRIETVTTRILETNSEIDNEEMFKSLRASQKRIKSRRTSLHYENKKQGLDAAETEEQLTVLAKQGNHSLRVTGVDSSGERLEGNNDNFKVKIPIASLPDDLPSASKELVRHFGELKKNKIVTVPDTSPEAIEKARNARSAMKS